MENPFVFYCTIVYFQNVIDGLSCLLRKNIEWLYFDISQFYYKGRFIMSDVKKYLCHQDLILIFLSYLFQLNECNVEQLGKLDFYDSVII